MRNRITLRALFVFTSMCCVVLSVWTCASNGVVIVVRNVSDKPIPLVIIQVEGQRVNLGKLEAGGRRRFNVRPTTESDVEVLVTNARGIEGRYVVDCYMEPNFDDNGTIEIDICSDDYGTIQANNSHGELRVSRMR